MTEGKDSRKHLATNQFQIEEGWDWTDSLKFSVNVAADG